MSKLLERTAVELASPNGAGVSQETPVVWLPLYQVQDNPYQPRQHYDAEHILNLALSIKQLKAELPATKGLQQLPLARLGALTGDGSFDAVARALYSDPAALRRVAGQSSAIAQLMFGHSRLRAWRVLAVGLAQFDHKISRTKGTLAYTQLSPGELGIDIDLSTVEDWQTRYAELMEADPDYTQFPVTLGFALDLAMWQHAITENSQRKNINPIEEASAMARAQAEFGLTDEQAGEPFGYARSTAANKMRLLKLPASVQRDIATGKLSERHGRELLRLADDEERLKKAHEYAVKKGQSVAQLTESVNWEAKALKEAQDKQRELAAVQALLTEGWTPPGSQTPLPADRLIPNRYPSFFDTADEKRMFKSGLCGSHCECCILAYQSYRPEDSIRPDAARAPHIGLACAGSYDVRKTKQEAWAALKAGSGEASEAERQAAEARAQRKAKAEELHRQAHKKWQQALAGLYLAGLWQEMRFWRVVTAEIQYGLDDIAERATSVREFQQLILERLYKNAQEYDRELEAKVPDLDRLDELINELAGVDEAQQATGYEVPDDLVESGRCKISVNSGDFWATFEDEKDGITKANFTAFEEAVAWLRLLLSKANGE